MKNGLGIDDAAMVVDIPIKYLARPYVWVRILTPRSLAT